LTRIENVALSLPDNASEHFKFRPGAQRAAASDAAGSRAESSDSAFNQPSLYIYRAENMLGRMPLMPGYISGNAHPTLPPRFGKRAGATADSDSSVGRGNRSRLYELNLWMWRYGRRQPHKVPVPGKKLSNGVGSD
jgi:hypothetical protein